MQEVITEDHWLRMRDTGSLDEEGFLALSGRCADAVKLQDEVGCDWRTAGHVTAILTSDWSGHRVRHPDGAARAAGAGVRGAVRHGGEPR